MDFQGGERGSKGGKKVGWLKGESGSNNLECFMFFSSILTDLLSPVTCNLQEYTLVKTSPTYIHSYTDVPVVSHRELPK